MDHVGSFLREKACRFQPNFVDHFCHLPAGSRLFHIVCDFVFPRDMLPCPPSLAVYKVSFGNQFGPPIVLHSNHMSAQFRFNVQTINATSNN